MHIWRLTSMNTVGHWMFCGQKGAWKKNCLGAFALYFMALWLGLAPCLDYFVFKFGLAVCLEFFAFNFGFALSLVHIATCSGVAIVLIRLRPERFANNRLVDAIHLRRCPNRVQGRCTHSNVGGHAGKLREFRKIVQKWWLLASDSERYNFLKLAARFGCARTTRP